MIYELEEEMVEPEYLNELYTFEELQDLAKSGEADKKISIGDQLKVDRNGKDIIFDVVKITNRKIYLLSHYLIAEMPFDAPEPENSDEDIAICGSNNYLTSSVRQWLNHSETDGEWWAPQTVSDRPIVCKDYLNGFMYKMNPEFLNCVAKNENGDTFFLPSEDEIKEWFPNEADRVKTYANKKKNWYWLRTPYLDDSYSVRFVSTLGALGTGGACGACGIAPACIIG